MDAFKALTMLARLEKAIGHLYVHFAKVFESDPAASALFERLSHDEDSHYATLQYQLRLVRGEPGAFGNVEVDQKEIEAIIAAAERAMASEKKPTLKAAVDLAAKIEGAASEYHYRTALTQSTPAIAELIQSLGVADDEHEKRIRDFIVSRPRL